MTYRIKGFLSEMRDYFVLPFSGKTDNSLDGRLDFIDGMRGVTMILVVYWHVLVMSLGFTTYTAQTLQLVRMPLFFFISGFFAYSFAYDREKLKKRLNNRVRKQLFPTLFIFVLFVVFESLYAVGISSPKYLGGTILKSIGTSFLGDFKSGYWFTFVLFEVFCVFAVFNYTLSVLKISRKKQGIILLTLAVVCGFLKWGYDMAMASNSLAVIKEIGQVLCLSKFFRYQCFFYLGASLRCFDKSIWSFLSRKFVGLSIALIAIIVFIYSPRYRVPIWIFYGAACTGILFLITVFFYLRRFFSYGIVGRGLIFVGVNTLPIYLFHYFLIRILKDLDLQFIAELIKKSAWIELPIVTCISLVIVVVVLQVDKLLKMRPRIHRLIFSV